MIVKDTVTDALRKAGVTAIDDDATADEMQLAVRSLLRMLRSWTNRRINIFSFSTMSVTATTAASYALTPVPARINSVRYKISGTETPMWMMTRDEYDNLPVKTSTGRPSSFYFDRQFASASLFVWPLLAAAAGTFEITYERQFADIDLASALPVLPEWEDAVLYNLAVALYEDYGLSPAQTVVMRAAETLEDALGANREESVYWHDPCA